jgi:uncharacterized membrane protein YfcA
VTAVLFLVGVVAGALNAVAGGGSFLGLPALLFAGVPPVAANATTTFAMWPASLASALAYREDIKLRTWWLIGLGVASLLGGLLGGQLLMQTTDANFMRALPWLMLTATLTLTFSGLITARANGTSRHELAWWAILLQLAIATYGGYFSGGIGIMMLAGLSAAGMTNIHEMNGLKAILTAGINGVALVEFFAYDAIAWTPGIVLAAGAVTGGFGAAHYARGLPPERVRTLIVIVAWILTVYFFVRAR